MMKQAQEMQGKMAEAQEQLASSTVEGSAGGGKVKVVCSGAGQIQSVSIDPEVVNAEEVEMLEDLVLSGVKQAQEEAAKLAEEQMQGVTGGMELPPGLGL